jgi:hypothetical protein
MTAMRSRRQMPQVSNSGQTTRTCSAVSNTSIRPQQTQRESEQMRQVKSLTNELRFCSNALWLAAHRDALRGPLFFLSLLRFSGEAIGVAEVPSAMRCEAASASSANVDPRLFALRCRAASSSASSSSSMAASSSSASASARWPA